jgi:hypothetical protein
MSWLLGLVVAIVVPLAIAAVLALVFAVVVWQTFRRRRYCSFRVVDGATGEPLAGAAVYRWWFRPVSPFASEAAQTRAMLGPGKPSVFDAFGRLGFLDTEGTFRTVLWPFGSEALFLRSPALEFGLIPVRAVAEFGGFPKEPYVCTARFGMLVPPERPSLMLLGYGPGEREEACEAFVDLYEKPQAGEQAIGWPTLEAAKKYSLSGSMARYWKVRGTRRGSGIGNGSFGVAVESAERVRVES